ncbi:alpha/beta hydrolase [Lapidilactobacillus gannanensis]|uniref:Alpha/beta hydrolase n=1 Tax=Lapidilactobacillus gannanensis TaxID=2486002 RepID=A0ABW4BNS4_9LACO|nr:alpha/beta hydrolase [Lapidilactobacillus gannanensis]
MKLIKKFFRNKKSWLLLGIFFGLIIILAFPSYAWTQANVKQMATRHNSKMSPVIMIPGSSATQDRFDELVQKINQADGRKHSLLKLKVMNSGQINVTGEIRPGDNEPFIVVGFENNQDGYDNIKKESKMFNSAFTQLTKKYNFNNFKAFGHSNGGLVFTDFLENYFDNDEITMKCLMTVGTPYNFEESSTSRKTQMLADFIKNRKKIPDDLVVYSLSGTQNYDSDGIVPINSVAAGKYIYQGQAASYTQITVSGKMAQHSAMLDNPQIITIMEQYLLNQKAKATTTNRNLNDDSPTTDFNNNTGN